MNFSIKHSRAVLSVVAIDSSGEEDISFVKSDVQNIAKPMMKFLPKGEYFLYIRNIKDYSIDGKYPAGHTYNDRESMIAVPTWNCDRSWVKSTVAHELHHLVRWQHAGYGSTLGEAILTEGLATYYESIIANWTPPWAESKLNAGIINRAKKEWNDTNYNHFDWFFEGEMGRWLGYTIGYEIVKQIYSKKFDLAKSFTINLDEFDVKPMLAKSN
jgi:hypothetical protein